MRPRPHALPGGASARNLSTSAAMASRDPAWPPAMNGNPPARATAAASSPPIIDGWEKGGKSSTRQDESRLYPWNAPKSQFRHGLRFRYPGPCSSSFCTGPPDRLLLAWAKSFVGKKNTPLTPAIGARTMGAAHLNWRVNLVESAIFRMWEPDADPKRARTVQIQVTLLSAKGRTRCFRGHTAALTCFPL